MLIRYPGSKDKHLPLLRPLLDKHMPAQSTVVEPFAGTASVTFDLLARKQVASYVINDIDLGMSSLWTAVRDNTDELLQRVSDYQPQVEDFYVFKQDIGDGGIDTAFRKLVIHQISYSGLGQKAGGPLGGAQQKSVYKVDCRWSPKRLTKKIVECAELLQSVPGTIMNASWEDAISLYGASGFLYLDPPYYVKGKELYVSGEIDHEGLADVMKEQSNWLISYDDVPQVRSLYDWANVERLDVRSHLHHKIIGDVAITPR